MPTVKLNARSIPALKARPDGRREVYRDTVVRGLYLHVHPTGRRVFGVWFRVKGRAGRLTLGPWQAGVYELADARDAARDALHDARKGIDPAAARRQRRDAGTFGDLIETFLAGTKGEVRPTSWSISACLLRHERLAGLRALKPEEITRGDIVRLLDKIAETAPYSANRTFEGIRRAFSWAVAKDLAPASPCIGIRKPTKEKPRQRAYSDLEMTSVLAALDDSAMGNAMRLCALTGVRIAQALGARWSELKLPSTESGAPDVANSTWLIPGDRAGTKNGVDWLVPLTDPAVDLLTRLKAEAKGPWVFPVRRRADATEGRAWRSQRAVNAVCERSGVSDFRPHDFRRSINSWLASQRVPLEVRDAILGHKKPGLEATYNVYEYAAEKRRALDRWARHLTRLAAERPAEKVVAIGASA